MYIAFSLALFGYLTLVQMAPLSIIVILAILLNYSTILTDSIVNIAVVLETDYTARSGTNLIFLSILDIEVN